MVILLHPSVSSPRVSIHLLPLPARLVIVLVRPSSPLAITSPARIISVKAAASSFRRVAGVKSFAAHLVEKVSFHGRNGCTLDDAVPTLHGSISICQPSATYDRSASRSGAYVLASAAISWSENSSIGRQTSTSPIFFRTRDTITRSGCRRSTLTMSVWCSGSCLPAAPMHAETSSRRSPVLPMGVSSCIVHCFEINLVRDEQIVFRT